MESLSTRMETKANKAKIDFKKKKKKERKYIGLKLVIVGINTFSQTGES